MAFLSRFFSKKGRAVGEPSPSVNAVLHLDPKGAASRLGDDPEIRVLDVRTKAEYEAGHLAGAVMVDFKAPGFAEAIRELDPSRTWLVHCRSGGRSSAALPKLQAAGFDNLIHMDGGYDGWVAEGLPTVNN